MGLWVVAVLLAAAPPATIKLASPGLSGVNVTPELQTFVTDHLNQQLVVAGVSVLSSSGVAAVLGLERQKQLLGCDAATNCIAEFANALGVDGLLLGNVGKFGAAFQLDVRVAAATDAHNLATVSIRVPDESALPEAITQAAAAVAQQLSQTMKVALTPIAQPAAPTGVTLTQYSGLRTGGMWTFLSSSAVLVASLVTLVVTAPDASTGAYSSPANQTAFGVALALGLSSVLGIGVGGLIWLFAGNEQVPVKAALVPTRDGFSFALGGVF